MSDSQGANLRLAILARQDARLAIEAMKQIVIVTNFLQFRPARLPSRHGGSESILGIRRSQHETGALRDV